MKIKVNELNDGETLFEEEVDPQALDADIEDVQFTTPISLLVRAFKQAAHLSLDAHASGERHSTCSRCLEEFDSNFEKDFTLQFETKGLEEVDVDSSLRDEMILDNPIRILCREDCKGLCASCGVNLNHENCHCR